MRALKERKISQQRRRRKMLGRRLMPRLKRALQAGRVVKPLRDPHPWTVTPMEPSSVGTFSMSARSNAGVSARASRQQSVFPTFGGEQSAADRDFEEDQDASENGQEWSEGGSQCKKRKQRQRRTTVAESDPPGFEECESSSEGGGDSGGSEDDSEEDVTLDGASDDDRTSGSSGSSKSEENDKADACSRRDVHRLLLESQNLLQDYEDGSTVGSIDDQESKHDSSSGEVEA